MRKGVRLAWDPRVESVGLRVVSEWNAIVHALLFLLTLGTLQVLQSLVGLHPSIPLTPTFMTFLLQKRSPTLSTGARDENEDDRK